MHNEEQEIIFDNWTILRAEMHRESEEYKRIYRSKYNSELELESAARAHVNRKYKSDSDKLWLLRLNQLSKTKDI